MIDPHSRNLRPGRRPEDGVYFAITFCCVHRRPMLSQMHAARAVVAAFIEQQAGGIATTFAFVVMPDHVHWLMRLEATERLSSVVGWTKRSAALRMNRMDRAPGRHVWQRGYYDHKIRDDVDLYYQASYILENPVRAGLVDAIEAYPHWDTPGWI